MIPNQSEMQESGYKDMIIPWPVTFYDEVFIQISTFMPQVKDRYWVSNFGRVYDAESGYCLIPLVKQTGYNIVNLHTHKELTNGNKSMLYPIHRLVCMAFHGMPLNPNMHANHIDCRTWNNDAVNLEWLSPRDNVLYSYQCGNRGYGEDANNAIFTNEQVKSICELLSSGVTDIHEISRRVFGVELNQQIKTLLFNIRSRKLWTSISKDYDFDPPPIQKVFSDDDVHRVCRYADLHKDMIGKRGFIQQLSQDVFGVNTNNVARKTPEYRLSAFIQTILRGERRRDISSMYQFSERFND